MIIERTGKTIIIDPRDIVLLGIKNLERAFLMRYHPELAPDAYYLPHFLEGQVKDLEFSDVIGNDHLDRLISAGIERPLYCFSKSADFSPSVFHPAIVYMVANSAGINATEIRIRIQKNDFDNLALQDEVLDYIKQNRLYI